LSEPSVISLNKNDFILDKSLLVIILNDKLSILKIAKKNEYTITSIKTTIQQIITLTNQIRTDYQSDESKSFLSKKSKPIFENAIETILQLYTQTGDKKYITQAFQLAEQSKSIILMDALQQAQARQTTDVPSELLDKENSLKRQIAQKEKALFLKEADANILNNDLIQLNQALEKLTDTLKQNYPKYHEAKYVTELPTIATIQNQIKGALIEYFVGDSTIYIFKIAKGQAAISVKKIPLDFPLAKWTKQLREGIYKPFLQKVRSDDEAKKYAQDLVDIAYQLHQKLIAPIIQPNEANEKLIIIPDGILGYIPFDVLISEQPEDATLFGAHDYLINDFQISYAYSATSLLEMQQKQFTHKATNDFVAFAPTFEGEQEVAFVRDVDAVRGELSPLEYNIPEVTAIQALIGGNLFTGMDATRANFIQNVTHSKIVHLATHGKANDETGDYAFLAFTDTEETTDFRLYNRDLYNLALNADMVVLSACETGIGELQKGEGIISLARGFTYAGAKSIVTTLWSINDNRTKEIMEGFYGYLKDGQPKDAALRQAKLDFIENYSHNAHPFFWAAFIPIGDMEMIEFSDSWTWKFGLIGLIGLLVFFFWWRRK